MTALGRLLGEQLTGGEVIELIGDIGAGKTTFTKGLASGLGVTEDVQSPTFTISRIYEAHRGLQLAHYDFYRLQDPGILKIEIDQAVHDKAMITVIEWGDIIEGVLPQERLRIILTSPSEAVRNVELRPSGEHVAVIVKGLTV